MYDFIIYLWVPKIVKINSEMLKEFFAITNLNWQQILFNDLLRSIKTNEKSKILNIKNLRSSRVLIENINLTQIRNHEK